MEFDRNYMPYYHMMNNMDNCPAKCSSMQKEMPPYMYGKYTNKWEQMPDMCSKYMNMYDNMPMSYSPRGEYMMPHINQNMEPLENMCGKTYKILVVHVHKRMHKMMMENMGVMPKGISKEKFNKEMNDMLCDIMKNEEEIKKIVVIDRSEMNEENTDRAFCPFCNGLLKDTLSILFVTELLKGGCTFCY